MVQRNTEELPGTRVMVLFSGMVQGVGFRYTAWHIACQRSVVGFVRNRPDCRVELVAEGNRAELDRLLDDIRERMGGYIDQCDIDWQKPTGQYLNFEIRN
jgi:acylphosphatase